MRGAGALAFLAATLGFAAPGHAAPPLCRAERLLEPASPVVGQPVLHRVRIERRNEVEDVRWATSLSFPSARAEWLHGRTGPGSNAETVSEEHRVVLFPGHAGALPLPAAELECESRERIERVPVPAGTLVVREVPAEGRPTDWNGLIGPVEVTVAGAPDRMRLGDSAHVTVVVSGATNVWAMPPPWRGALAPEAAELFDRPPELAREAGRELVLRRYFGFDLVPRRAGELALPDVRVPYYDPTRGRYDEARAPGLRITVSEPARPAADESPPAPAPSEAAKPRRAPWLGLLLAVGAGAVATFLVLRRLRRPARVATPGGDPLAALRTALAANDADAAAASASRAVRERLAAALPGARTEPVEALARAADTAATRGGAALLARLDAARFGGGPPLELLALAREAEDWLADR